MSLGVSLSGGGIKGAAHIGVLKALEEEGIAIDYISGTSSGSIVATLYALGYKPEEIYIIFKKWCKKIKYVTPSNLILLIIGILFKGKIIITGLNNGKMIEKLINKYANKKRIKNVNEIKMPLIMPSVDLEDGSICVFCSKEKRNTYSDQIHYINNIEIGKAVRSSCSYPGIFSPCQYKEKILIDGGIRENIPWKETKKIGADKVISVIFKKELEKKENINIIDVIESSIEILSHELANYEIMGADYLIEIETLPIGLLDYKKMDYLYKKGYMEAKKKIKEIKNQLNIDK